MVLFYIYTSIQYLVMVYRIYSSLHPMHIFILEMIFSHVAHQSGRFTNHATFVIIIICHVPAGVPQVVYQVYLVYLVYSVYIHEIKYRYIDNYGTQKLLQVI